MSDRPEVGGIRISELVATLSYAADLGLGQPMEHCMRQTVIAVRLADLVGAGVHDREATYYLGLLMNVFCHADAAEQARWLGDEITFKGDAFDLLGMSTSQTISFLLRRIASHGSGVERAKRVAAFPVVAQKRVGTFLTTHSTLGAQFASRIGLDDGVSLAIRQAYEQWDGKGYPRRLRGEEICLPARLVQLAGPVEVLSRRRGIEAARAIVRKHRGSLFDPAVADLFREHASKLLDGLDGASGWDAVLDAEPGRVRRVAESDVDGVLQAMADLVDLKSPTWPATARGGEPRG
jgi:HD domain